MNMDDEQDKAQKLAEVFDNPLIWGSPDVANPGIMAAARRGQHTTAEEGLKNVLAELTKAPEQYEG